MPFVNEIERQRMNWRRGTYETFDDACMIADILAREGKEATMVFVGAYEQEYRYEICRLKDGTHPDILRNSKDSFIDRKEGIAIFQPITKVNPNDKKTEGKNGGILDLEYGNTHPAMIGINDCMELCRLGLKYPFWNDIFINIARVIMLRLESDPESRLLVDLTTLVLGGDLPDEDLFL